MRKTILAGVCALAFASGPLAAQEAAPHWDPQQAQLTRASLQGLLARYQQMASSSAYSGDLRGQANREGQLIRARLEEGDFSVGDRVALVVEGQQTLSDTFPVLPGRKLVLPQIGDIPPTGVLRSELQDYLRQRLGQFIVSPIVHARALVRVYVSGSVGHPGFYVLPSEGLLSDVLMTAGGPGGKSDLARLEILRGSTPIWGGARLQEALRGGATLDQLSLRAGDEIRLPERPSANRILTVLQYVVPLATLVSLLIYRW